MYDLGPDLDEEVPPGTNVLVSGPPLSGKRSLCLDILASGVESDEGAIIVTTKDGADRVLKDFEARTPYEDRPVAVVDCVTRQQGVSDVRDDDRIKYTSSPVDMTGIGIKLSEFLQGFYQNRGIERNRVMLHSLSTLLMYADLQTVFRFLHVFTGRIQSVDGLGVFAIDDSAHDDQTMNTLKQLFDGIVTTQEDGPTTVRLAGD
jgi:KaiC/GvpD/RAD55 family RecA-like ATPase